jgi:predicted RNase H-like nuclease (RuvC/YqgF family)
MQKEIKKIAYKFNRDDAAMIYGESVGDGTQVVISGNIMLSIAILSVFADRLSEITNSSFDDIVAAMCEVKEAREKFSAGKTVHQSGKLEKTRFQLQEEKNEALERENMDLQYKQKSDSITWNEKEKKYKDQINYDSNVIQELNKALDDKSREIARLHKLLEERPHE